MSSPAEPAGTLSRAEKQELLRAILAKRIHRTRTAPASFAQERMWLLDRVEGAGSAYLMHGGLRIPGPLDRAALERAVGELVRRHESLRTVFSESDGVPLQVIAPFEPLSLAVEEVADDEDVNRVAAQELTRPFDLASGPLFRPLLLRKPGGEHALLFTMHHAVSDGWSLGVIAREVAELYDAFRAGKPSPLPEPAFQYADYAAQQRERLRGAALERQLAYWRERLGDAPALLELPTDHPRPAVQGYRGRSVPVILSREVVAPLEALARREGSTLHMVLLAAFQLLLGRYAGTEDVVVGSPVAGRGREELEGLVGFFVNTVALRTDLSGDPTFRELLRRVRSTTLGAYTHQDLPFERVVAEVRPERSRGHLPLVQVMFSLDTPPPGVDGGAGMEALALDVDGGTSKFDLTLFLEMHPEGCAGMLEYRTDLFEEATIRRFGERWKRVLRQVGADPELRLSRLELMDGDERRQVVQEWNRTATAYPRDADLPALFAAQVARAPDAPALVFGDVRLTYAQLNARANRLAHHLVRAGAVPEARIGIHLERGAELVIALLATVKAGAAYVPLEPGYPAERLAFMAADAGVSVLVTQDSLRAALPVSSAAVVSVDGDAARIAAGSAEDPGRSTGPRGLAYVIYTSGSTGTPKGVGVEQRGVVRLVMESDSAPMRPGDRVGQASTPAFDVATYEVWGALLNGAALVVIPRDAVLAPERLEALLRAEAVTVLILTTSLFNQVARERPAAFAGMRAVLFGGEAADADALRAILRAAPPERLENAYGPTENTTFSSCHTVRQVAPDAATVPIGRPVSNSTAYVLDRALAPLPPGLAGELYVGGDGVARGYLGRPALTAQRFVPDPFSMEPGARMYGTGDRARWRPDGTLDYLGRLDGQVKIRGFRIETGEIESAVRSFPGVTDCVVVVAGEGGDRRLVAYVVGAAHADALRAHLRRTLPDYMVPGVFIPLERLPLTANGKLDRRALPAPRRAAREHVAPRTPAEQALAGIWAEVLRVDSVGAEDDFFALGGHSLLATRVISRVRAAFGVEPTVRALFEAPTLAELARVVEGMQRGDRAELPPIVRVARRDALPLSLAQERLWLADRLRPGSAVYNVPAAVRLRGALDADALRRALGEIVRRHEALRTTFADRDGARVQVIHPFAGLDLPVEDLSAGADGEDAMLPRVEEEGARPFDLERGPLVRARLFRLADDDHVLLVCMHHVVTDGWSLGVFFRELAALYGAFREGRPSPLAELPVQYPDYAAWQRAHLGADAMARHLAYWRQRMAGAPALLQLPTDRPRPAQRSDAGGAVPVELPAALAERLEALARAEGASLYMVLVAAFQLLLGRYAGSEDVVVGSPVAGRTRGETEGLIGFFVNTVVLRTSLAGDPSFRELLGRVRAATLEAYEHQELPFETLVAELQPERSSAHSPLFQALVALQNADGSGGDLAGLRAEPVEPRTRTAMFDLMLMLAPHAGGLAGELTYAADLWERETIARMLGHFVRLLEQVADDADRRVSRLELLDGAEQALLEAWSGADAPYPADACLHGLFQAQAARTPHAAALLHEGETFTYAALNARANRVAQHLRRLGVGPETRVGICLPRSAELVAGILGILKAGGAYVPLDPAWPAERLAFMLADSGASVLVTADATAGVLPAMPDVRLVRVDADAADIAAESAEDPDGGARPENLAYLIYTSGSTGLPKGVAIQHRSAAALLAWAWATFPAEELDRMLASTSVCFDMSVFELFAPLTRGGRVVLVENALALPSSPHAGQVRLVDTVPSAMRALLETDDGLPAGVRTVCLGGEPLPQELVDAIYARGVERVYDLYGPTEDTTFSTVALRRAGGTPHIGNPLPNSRAWVVDAGLRPAPVGVPGELCLAGRGLARGYLGRPALTAERFIPDPLSTEPGGRMYRTGDRVRWRVDGMLQYQGRMDHQVKIRGFRVEPGEVESVLRRHPEVAEAAVVARAEAGEVRLVAYVAGAAADDELRDHLRRHLPEYMVPAVFVRMERMPLTPSGKIDRLALPAPEPASAADRPRGAMTPVEEVLAGIWASVLRVEHLAPGDNFFHLGGHSLLATSVAARVQETLGVRLSLSSLFQSPTLAELAARVESLRRAGAPALAAVVPVARDGDLPLSWAQERLFFLDRLQPGLAFYNVPFALSLSGALDAGALERALGEIVRRHEVLRTTFRERDGAPHLHVAPFAGFHLPIDDLSSSVDAEGEARRRAADEAARPFDLQAGPLFRARLLRLGADEHVLLVSMHHAVSDEWSLGVLFRELSAGYTAALEGRGSPLPELPVQYADYTVWQREQLRGEALERQLAYWRERLDGAPALIDLPTDHPRPALQTHRGASEPFQFPAELLRGLEALGRGEGATLYMVMLGALQVLLSRYGNSEDVVVGSPITGRMRHETEGLIGFFANTLVLRTDVSGDPPFREVLRRARETALGAYDHQDVPFERLVEALQPERSLGHSPLFQVMLLQGAGDPGGFQLPGIELHGFAGGSETSKFDLTLAFIPDAEGLGGSMEYSTDLFERATVRRMLGHLRRVLEQVVRDPDAPVSALELLGDDERRAVLEDWNRTDAAFPADACVHHLVEAQAARTPDAPAVVHGSETLTYRQLDERANGLAHRLAELGVGPEVRVGICLERGPAMVVAVLAVLKAGGAYVPLDPNYPAARLAFMAADSAVPVLLTQASLRPALPALDGVRVLYVDHEAAEPRAASPDSGAGPANLAFVLYTSGSTGTPKGVAMPHAALVNLVTWQVRESGGPRNTLQFSSLSFDVSFQEIAATLASGGALVLVDDALRRDPGELLRYLGEHRVERLFLPFVALQSLADAAAAAQGALAG